MFFNLGEKKICLEPIRSLRKSKNIVISSQNNVQKYHTKGNEQDNCLLSWSKLRPNGVRLYVGTAEE